ncbi:MAG TPA: ankyrin repeat domain-containing protein [Candidatus Acidoferrales bacterium]|jgi:ankyrin repeat protein|nr:ankyrin repeat domain-containing protein [Candidatus Acidoferrales bacterium]
MKQLPASPNLSHLKKQAKELLRSFRQGNAEAMKRVIDSLPSAQGLDPAKVASRPFQLHDAQSCVAREYGFPSWTQLKEFVELQSAGRTSREEAVRRWLVFVYGEGYHSPRAKLAARLLGERPDLLGDDPYLACAAGDEASLRRKLDADATWANRPGGAMAMPPLIAVTHSGLVRLPEYAGALERCASLLLDRGADVNLKWSNPPNPEWPLSAIYGASGKNHHPGMTRLLLARGADPNDNESLYHSVEGPDLTCTRLLLDAGARVEGSNAVAHALDSADQERIKLLLAHTKSLREHDSHTLPHAVRRGQPLEVIRMLLDKGADPTKGDRHGTSAYRFAMLYGRPDVAELLGEQAAGEQLSPEDAFVAACGRADTDAARKLLSQSPNLIANLSEEQLRQLPNLASQGNFPAVKLMVEMGWPIGVTGGDWKASALNLAVFRGDAAMADWLLSHGASWEEKHGFGGNVMGTLGYGSVENVAGYPEGDWLACAKALIAHGMPLPPPSYEYSDAVEEYFDGLREGDTTKVASTEP